MPLMLTIHQIRNNPIPCGWLDDREYTRGKSGLLKAAVPGNARAGQPDGKRNRKYTARFSGKGERVG